MNSPFGQELCNHRNHWKWYDGRVIHEGRWHFYFCKNKSLPSEMVEKIVQNFLQTIFHLSKEACYQ